MNPLFPLEFHVPESLERTQIDLAPDTNEIPPMLRFGRSKSIKWGNKGGNSMLQHLYSNATINLLFITFSIEEFCVLPVSCLQECNAIHYIIKGNTIAFLEGQGNLPILERTYLLQTIPKGNHKMLMAPGIYQFIYILPGPYLSLLTEKHTNNKSLFRKSNNYEKWELELRLPTVTKIASVLRAIQRLSSNDEKLDFSITTQVLQLLLHADQQLCTDIHDIQPSYQDLPAYINHFVGSRLQMPVQKLIDQIKDRFHIEAATLRNHWNFDAGNRPGHRSNPRTELNAIRLKLAIFLLVYERLPVSAVAEHLSYASIYSFSDQFKSHFGFSPIKALGRVYQ